MEGVDRHAVAVAGQQPAQAIAHLVGGTASEGHGEAALRRDARRHEVGDAAGEGSRLAGSRSGNYQQRTVDDLRSQPLVAVEAAEDRIIFRLRCCGSLFPRRGLHFTEDVDLGWLELVETLGTRTPGRGVVEDVFEALAEERRQGELGDDLAPLEEADSAVLAVEAAFGAHASGAQPLHRLGEERVAQVLEVFRRNRSRISSSGPRRSTSSDTRPRTVFDLGPTPRSSEITSGSCTRLRKGDTSSGRSASARSARSPRGAARPP